MYCNNNTLLFRICMCYWSKYQLLLYLSPTIQSSISYYFSISIPAILTNSWKSGLFRNIGILSHYLSISGILPHYLTIIGILPHYLTISGILPHYLTIIGILPHYLTISGILPHYLTISGILPHYLTISGILPNYLTKPY